jgi:putative restriction endonuclease
MDEEAISFPEGRVKYALHKRRERDPRLIEAAKKRASRKNPGLPCEVCGFSFLEAYGSVGAEFIEGHHTVPVSQLAKQVSSRIEDIALVCSNCHRMLHRRRPWLTMKRLRNLVMNIAQ